MLLLALGPPSARFTCDWFANQSGLVLTKAEYMTYMELLLHVACCTEGRLLVSL